MEIKRLEQLVEKLRGLAAKAQLASAASVSVGYTAKYALFVHEDLEAAHGADFNVKHADEIAAGMEHSRGENQQAKFLESPARQLTNDGTLRGIVRDALRSGKTMTQALLLAALRIQRESMKIVPVDTGLLRSTAFTRVDPGSPA